MILAAAEEVTALDLATLAIAVLGFGLGAAGFALRIADYRRAAAKLHVELEQALYGPGGVISWPLGSDPKCSMPADITTPAFVVRLRNKGLAATTIERVVLSMGPGLSLSAGPVASSPTLPLRLEGLGSELLIFDAWPVVGVLQSLTEHHGRDAATLCVVVDVGDGSSVRTPPVKMPVGA